MTIEVEGPGGAVVEFPDGTPPAQIQAAMARHFGPPQTPQMQRATADAAKRSAGVGGFEKAVDNGFAFNGAGVLDAGLAAGETGLHNAFSHLIGRPDAGYGMGDAFNAVKATEQQAAAKYAADHPVANFTGGMIGAIANPINRAGGKYVMGAKSLPGAIGRSVAVAAPTGAAYGFIGAPDGQRLEGAGLGAALGTAAGVAVPAAGAALRPVARMGRGAAIDFARGIKNTIRPPDPAAPPSPQDIALARAKVQQMMLAARMTPDTIAAHPAVAAAKPITTAEAIGRTGINNLGALARRSGETGDALGPMLMDRHAEAPTRIMQDFATAAGIHPEAAAGDIEGLTSKLRSDAGPLYTAALSDPGPVWNADLAQLAQRPAIKRAIADVGQDFLNAGKDPTTAGLQLDPDTGLHVLNPDLTAANERQPTAATWDAVKQAIGRQVERHPITNRVLPDSQSKGNGGIMNASRDLTRVLAGDPATGVEGAIPGYRAALDKAGDYLQLEDAFAKGGKLLTDPRVNESIFADVHAGLDEASQHAFKGGFANKLYDMAQNNQLSPAKFRTPRVQQKLAAVLGPDNATSFLRNVQLEGQMQANGNRMMPGVNSPTFEFANAAREQDAPTGILQSITNAHLNPFKLVGAVLDAGRSAATGPQVTGEMGRILMQDPSASAGEMRLLPNPPRQGLFGAQYYPAVATEIAQQFGG